MKIFSIASFSIVLITGICTIESGVCELDPDVKETIDNLIQEILKKRKIPAISLGIVRNGEVAYATAYGKRNLENSIPADKSTLFFIGSISKSFTATICVKVLSEKFPELGEAVLDTPIRKLIPSYNFTLSDRYRSESTSFADLLAHRVGEKVQTLNLVYGSISDSKELAYRLRYSKEQSPFRTNFVYNNGHYALVGDIIAEIAGVPFHQLLKDFLEKLGMSGTTYCKATDDHDNMPNRAMGYYYNGTNLRFNSEYYKTVLPYTAAGGILSNAEDMMKYGLFHLNLGRVGETQLIPESVMKWMYTNKNPFPTTWKTKPEEQEYFNIGYGLGFMLSGLDGWQVVHHGGYLPPFFSQFTLFPALNISIFTGTNSNGEVIESNLLPQMELHKEIFNIMQGEVRNISIKESLLGTSRKDQKSKSALETTPSKHPWESADNNSNVTIQSEEILGHYANGLVGELDITEKLNSSGKLQPYLNYGDWGTGWLHQISNNAFSVQWESAYVQTLYAMGQNETLVKTYFSYDKDNQTLVFHQSILNEVFQKNQTLINLPKQLWSSDSCGPEV